MEQPFHSQRAVKAGFTPQKAVWLGAAILLQAGFVYALINGLAATIISKLPEELKVAVEQEKIAPKPPPPPPPQVDIPPPPVAPPPDINIQIDAPAPSITYSNKPPPPVQPKAPTSTPVSIGRPHVCGGNYYPQMSVKLNEEGTATAAFKVTADGSVTDVSIAKSSGSSRLDDATITCVQHWKYKPATTDGTPIEMSWQAAVQWKLR